MNGWVSLWLETGLPHHPVSLPTNCLISLYQLLSGHPQVCCSILSLYRFPSAKRQAVLSLSSAFIPKILCFFFSISLWAIFSNSLATQRRGQSHPSGTSRELKKKKKILHQTASLLFQIVNGWERPSASGT